MNGEVRSDKGQRQGSLDDRNDLSRFVVHLTRDDRDDYDNGLTARKNFDGIAEERTILALHPHCLHKEQIPKKHWPGLSVCYFTDVPLCELHLLTRHIPGRRYQYSEYGFVFSGDFLISKGAQPAIYVNSYDGNMAVKEAADRICELAAEEGFRQGKLSRLLPYLNAMHEGYDFASEREWRVAGHLKFAPKGVVCVILPEDDEEELKEEYLQRGVPVVLSGLDDGTDRRRVLQAGM